MPSLMSQLNSVPADPMISMMLTARADQRAEKVDFGMGIYRDASGATPVMAAVKAAEQALLVEESTKAYEGPTGNLQFCEHAETLIVGRTSSNRAVFCAPGGCGALFVGLGLARLISATGRLFVSDPTWPNHINMAAAAGFDIAQYTYQATEEGTPDLEQVLDGLKDLRSGDVVLLQGPCHNPTGIDFSEAQWAELASFLLRRGALPFIDVAYQGFGQGVDADMHCVRMALEMMPEAIVSYSFSKTFGLYRERTGALLLQAPDQQALAGVQSQAAALIRASYSMPPAHGAAIVARILAEPSLKAQWLSELDSMRQRLQGLRKIFAEALASATGNPSHQRLAKEKGMFSMLNIKPGAAAELCRDHAIYLPASGRLNLASLPEERADEIAERLAPYLNPGN